MGVATGGSINIDGASAIRRSCNLTLTTMDCHINEYVWVLNTLFSISIGLENTVKSQYPEYANEDIIWFNQGHYVITSFNASLGTSQYNISISGQDKMCLLNGEVGGIIMMETDFGKYNQLDENGDIAETKVLTIRQILENIIFEYTREKCEEDQIELPEGSGLNLIEYRGDTPLYMLMEEKTEDDKTSWEAINMTVFGDQTDDNGQRIDSLASYLIQPSLADENGEWIEGTTFVLNEKNYQVLKIEYGETAGYEKTELTYAGDLVAGVGENVTAILDKIKNMLGEYEYFYDLDGKFRFQKKRTYLKTLWNDGKNESEDDGMEEEEIEEYFYQFDDMKLFTSFANTPNLKNLKNDFSVWGSKKSATGNELPIHMRLAIDNKPLLYTSPYQIEEEVTPPAEEEEVVPPSEEVNGDEAQAANEVAEETPAPVYKVYDSSATDWRELIYQMARDYSEHNGEEDFYEKLQEQNTWIEEGGRTYYEQYYTDLEGFWRQLYNPNDPVVYSPIYYNNINTGNTYYTHPWVLLKDFTGEYYDKKDLYVGRNSNGQSYYCSWIDSLDLKDGIDVASEVKSNIQIYVKTRDAIPEEGKTYYYKTNEKRMSPILSAFNENVIHYEQVTDKITVDSVYTKTAEGEYELLLSGNYITDYNRYYVLNNKEEYVSLEQSEEWVEQKTDNIIENIVYKNVNGNSAFIYDNYVALDPFSTWKTWESIDATSVLPQLYIYRARSKDYYAVNTYDTSDFSDGWSSQDYYDVRDGYNNPNISFKCRVGASNVDNGYELKSGDKLYIKRKKYNSQEGYVPYINYYSRRIPLAQYLNYYGVVTERDENKVPTKKQKLSEKDLYIAQHNDDNIEYVPLLDSMKIHKDELYVEITEKGTDDTYGPAHFELLSNIVKIDENNCFIKDTNQYEEKGAPFNQFENYGQMTWDGSLDSSLIIQRPIQYYEPIHNYTETGWHKNVDSNPEALLFWFDFLDPVEEQYAELEDYAVRAATRRPMAKNESSVKAIYYPPTPRVYFTVDTLNIPEQYRNLFVISSQGVDAKETLDNWLYNHTYITESVTINSVPIYHLEPNTKIKIEDEDTGISGDYIVDKLTIPLTYNGMMTINATKAPSGFGAEN